MGNYIYYVTHKYLAADEAFEMKAIGAFSSEESANQAINISFNLKGFKKHPRKCYNIEIFEVDDISRWENGLNKDDLITIK
ncbi:DUF7336 domain-containing protein [Dysgonomonas massiliensis]|uniref:DUF7336 domain-containing protein n=1 Tax=Dysgonomonas massiliensis TaxID=2040292 RepID=UPI000C77CE6C|nr:hypothetical protein [Dysgonomonas massiliensis]